MTGLKVNKYIIILLCCFLLSQGSTLYSQEILHEKIFVHTDKNYYHAGEIVWFRVFNVDKSRTIPTGLSKLAYVELLDSINKPVLQSKIRLENGAGNGSLLIPPGVPTGTYILRSYTNWMKNFGPEVFFEKEIAVVNAGNGGKAYVLTSDAGQNAGAGALNIQLQTDKKQYLKRQKVKLSISSLPSADLSIAVYMLDSLVSEDPVNINSLLIKDPDLKDPVQFPFPPEYSGHFVNGRMINRNTRMPSKNVAGYLTVMDDANSFYNSLTDKDGKIKFLVTKLNAADSIIVQTHSYYDRDQQIEIENPFSEKYTAHKSSLFTATDKFASTVLEQSINAQATQLYYEEQLNRFSNIKHDSMPFYLKEDAHYVLDDYIRFSRLEDVFREYIRPVGVTKRQGVFHLTVFTETNRYLLDQEPLVLVDAVPVFNLNTFFTYDPLKVKTIDIVRNKYFRSGAVFPGIISLTTFRGKTDGQLIDSNANVLKYEIIQKQRTFYSPSNETPVSTHLPDFRTTLYWNPSIHTNASGNAEVEFYTSDLSGEYVISVQGIGEGKTGVASARINCR